MTYSKHLQQCVCLTLGAIATGLAFRYRNRIRDYFRQNHVKKFTYDTWVIYSGPNSLKWIQSTLLPQWANQNIALDTVCDIPGKYRSDNIIQLAEKSDRVIIVLGPETLTNKWLRYQVAVALQRDKEKISIYSLEFKDQIQVTYLSTYQVDNILKTPGIELEFKYDFWVIYSGLRSQNWILDMLPAARQRLNKRVAIDIECYVPGKTDLENIVQTANKSERAIIVLDPDTFPDELFRYEVEHALMKGPQNVLVVQLEPVEMSETRKNAKFKCLKPFPKIQISQTPQCEGILAIKQFLDK